MRYLSLFFLLLFVAACTSQKQENRELIMRKWKYDLEATRAELLKEPVSDRQVSYMEGVMDRLQFATMEFKPDGKITLNLNNQDMPGEWEMGPGGDEVTINLTGIPQTSVILDLTKDRLVMRQKQESELNFDRVMVPAEE